MRPYAFQTHATPTGVSITLHALSVRVPCSHYRQKLRTALEWRQRTEPGSIIPEDIAEQLTCGSLYWYVHGCARRSIHNHMRTHKSCMQVLYADGSRLSLLDCALLGTDMTGLVDPSCG